MRLLGFWPFKSPVISRREYKDEFLAVLSHELRSPLNPILGWSKLLQRGKLDAQASRRALEVIERNAKLQAQLIEDLLDVSRILQGKIVLNPGSVSLITVIEGAIETVRLAAESKSIDLQFTYADAPEQGFSEQPSQSRDHAKAQLVQVHGDSARLQQVVWNLLSNAIKFTPNGGQVSICLKKMETYAQIQVKDTGKGISPDFLPYVFDYFRQEDGAITRKFGGLGLGLAIVKHLTELHGGSVVVDSLGEGQGTSFTVEFSLLPTATALVELKNTLDISSSDFSGLQILVVDDDEDMRMLMQMILEQQGAQVNLAKSAAEAIALFEQQPPDLLISDIGMPNVDGYMLMRQVRSRPPEKGGWVSAIALSAYAGEYDQRQALKAGFQKHISKPVEPDALLREILELQQQPESSPNVGRC